MPSGRHALQWESQKIILCVLKFMKKEAEEGIQIKLKQIQKRTAAATGVSLRTVQRIASSSFDLGTKSRKTTTVVQPQAIVTDPILVPTKSEIDLPNIVVQPQAIVTDTVLVPIKAKIDIPNVIVQPQAIVTDPALVPIQSEIDLPNIVVEPQAIVTDPVLVPIKSEIDLPNIVVEPQAIVTNPVLVPIKSEIDLPNVVQPQAIVTDPVLVPIQSEIDLPNVVQPQAIVTDPALVPIKSEIDLPNDAITNENNELIEIKQETVDEIPEIEHITINNLKQEAELVEHLNGYEQSMKNKYDNLVNDIKTEINDQLKANEEVFNGTLTFDYTNSDEAVCIEHNKERNILDENKANKLNENTEDIATSHSKPNQWPTLRILPGGLITNDNSNSENKVQDSQETAPNENKIYACAHCNYKTLYVNSIESHVGEHTEEWRKLNVNKNIKNNIDNVSPPSHKRLLNAPGFFNAYERYIMVIMCSVSTEDQEIWTKFVESKFQNLIMSLRSDPRVLVAHANPVCYNSVPPNTNRGRPLALPPGFPVPTVNPEIIINERGEQLLVPNYCASRFIGIVKNNNAKLNLVRVFKSFLLSVTNNAKKSNILRDGMSIQAKQLCRNDLHKYLSESLLVADHSKAGGKRKRCDIRGVQYYEDVDFNMSSSGLLSGRRGRGGRQSRRGHTYRGGRVSRQPRRSPIVVVEDNQLIREESEFEDIQLEPPANIEVGEQRTSRVRTRGGQSAIRIAPRTRVRTRGGRSTERVRTRGGQARGGRDSAGDILHGSPRASTSTPEAPSSVSSPVLFMEIGENELTNLDVQMTQSPNTRSNLEIDVPSPAQFIECGGSKSSTPCTIRSETFPPRTRRILTDIGIDNILNFGSEEESESEDEAFPVFVPRSERIFFRNDDAEDESLISSSALPAPSTNLPEGSGHISFSEKAIQYRTPAGPEQFHFDWKSFPETPIPPRNRREIFREAEGPVLDFAGQSVPSPEAIFLSIWDSAIMGHIVTETNRYAEDEILKRQDTLGPESRLHRWTPTDVDELYVYFGVLLAMGLCIKSNIKEYWHCEGSIGDTPNFSKYISYNRFILLNKFIHFTKNSDILSLSPSEAKIYKIKPIADHLNQKFQSLYKLKQNICIDESLTQWKGWLAINQFINNKAASIGVKTYEVCDAKSGYLWRFKIHSGNQQSTTEPPTPLSGTIPSLVLHLLQGLENRGHCVWMDNYYNSPALARALKTMGFDCVGTLRTNRQFVPPQLASLQKDNMAVGEIQGCTSGDVDILVWRDQNRVATISTYHGNAVQRINDTIKPIVVLDYNLCMGGVDRKDQKLAMFPMERKRTRVWYKKLFKRLLNVSVLNSFILHTEYPEPEHPVARFTSHRGFRLELINKLLKRKVEPPVDLTSHGGVPCLSDTYFKHLPKEYRSLPGRCGEKLRRVCVVCRKRTHVYCPGCNATLCPFTCFAEHHANK